MPAACGLPGAVAGLLLLATSLAADSSRLGIFAEEDPQTPETWRLVWSAMPGQRYEVQESVDLRTWAVLPGFPAVADGPAQQMPLSLTGQARYFRVRELDEQPPVIVHQYPKPDGFALPRLAGLTVEIEDATGVDPASLRLTVEPLGSFTLADPQLSFTNNLLSLTSANDRPLGPHGAKVAATLIVADVLGNRGTNTWSFDLEVEPKVVTNLFVFGSGGAQRLGQKVAHLPTAALAQRAGPALASPGDSWTLERVEADRLILAYTGSAPALAVGSYLSNLTPRRPEEIFYRKITTVSDDPAQHLLTLFTTDVPLAEMVSQGSAAITGDSSILDLSDTGDFTGTRRLASQAGCDASLATVAGFVNFPRMGLSLDGAEFKLRRNGFESRIGDVTLELGDKPDLLRIKAEQLHWWLTPRLDSALTLDLGGLQRFEAIASGNVATATILDVDVLLLGIAANDIKIFDLPETAEPKVWMIIGVIGPVPVFASLGFDLQVKATFEARADLNGRFGLTLDADAAFGAAYTRGEDVRWMRDFRFASVAEPFTAQIMGETSLEVSVEPKIEFLVYGLAGLSAGVTPSGRGIFQAGTATPLTGRLEADVSLALGLDGPAFEAIHFTPELSCAVWEEEWHLFPKETSITFRQQPQNQTVTAGDSAYFACAATTSQTPRYQWVHDGIPLPGQDSRTLVLPNVTYRHAGAYWVEVTAGSAKAKSAYATLTVDSGTLALSGMVLVPAGTFQMGDTFGEGSSDELPVHTVTVSDFYMDRTEVTKALWDEVYMWALANGYSFDNSGSGKAANHPVHTVNWYDVVKWCNARSEKEGRVPAYYTSSAQTMVYRTGQVRVQNSWMKWNEGYRLPTEAEWEKAARGNLSGKRFPWGDDITHSRANYSSSPSYTYDVSPTRGYHPTFNDGIAPYTSPVGSFAPNAYGLYDMAGNIWELCWDWYDSSYYNSSHTSDPRGSTSGSRILFRGGGWDGLVAYCRTAFRSDYWPAIGSGNYGHGGGFRSVLSPGQP